MASRLARAINRSFFVLCDSSLVGGIACCCGTMGGTMGGTSDGTDGTMGKTMGGAVDVTVDVTFDDTVDGTVGSAACGIATTSEGKDQPKEDLTRSVAEYDISPNKPTILSRCFFAAVNRNMLFPPFAGGVIRYSICFILHTLLGSTQLKTADCFVRSFKIGEAGVDGKSTVSVPHNPQVFEHSFCT